MIKKKIQGFPGSPVVKTLPFNTRDEGSIPGQGTDPTGHQATKPACHCY